MISKVFNLKDMELKDFHFGRFVTFEIWGKTLAISLTAHQELFEGTISPKKGQFKIKSREIKNPFIQEELTHLLKQDPHLQALVKVTYYDSDMDFDDSECLLWLQDGKIYYLPVKYNQVNFQSLYPWIGK